MKIIISNSSSIPIYEQIKSAIINQIMAGELVEGEMIPSIRSLACDIKISVMTIKKAYDELESEGYIKSVQGKGTFVSSINDELLKEKANEGKIIFFSTHVLDVAEKLCNRIAIIKDGKLIVDGDMSRIIKDKSLEETFMELVVDE